MPDNGEEKIEGKKDLTVKNGNGEIVFELKDVGILSVEGSEGSLTIEVELNDYSENARSVFKTG